MVPEPRCTIDSTCVIALDHLDLLPKLSVLFSAVLIPIAVRGEYSEQEPTKSRLEALLAKYDFVKICDQYDAASVAQYFIDRQARRLRDRGEAEAVQQAAQTGAMVIVDDAWGRRIAKRLRIEFHGTMWILQRMLETGLLSASEVRECFMKLRRRDFRLPWSTVNSWLERLGQPEIN